MSTNNIHVCFYEEVEKQYTDGNLKMKILLDYRCMCCN